MLYTTSLDIYKQHWGIFTKWHRSFTRISSTKRKKMLRLVKKLSGRSIGSLNRLEIWSTKDSFLILSNQYWKKKFRLLWRNYGNNELLVDRWRFDKILLLICWHFHPSSYTNVSRRLVCGITPSKSFTRGYHLDSKIWWLGKSGEQMAYHIAECCIQDLCKIVATKTHQSGTNNH